MPQFLLYAKRANEEKSIQLNIKTVNEYVNIIFGGKSNKDDLPPQKNMEEDDPNNFMWKIKEAKERLIERTGRKAFRLQEILTEIEVYKVINKGN